MLIPNGPRGVSTVSVSMLRTYGVAGFDAGLQEESKGCPRLFQHRYVLRDLPKRRAEVLTYGTVIHSAFELMETRQLSPEDALAVVWDASLSADRYAEALADLRGYLEREDQQLGAVLATEVALDAVLFDDPETGPVYFRGTLDTVELDFEDEYLLRVRDFKTNRQPPSLDDVRADAQGKAYSWLVLQNLEKFGFEAHDPRVRVIFHLDAIKWRELLPVYFTPADLEAWHAWMVAIVRHIQADEQALPMLNPGCATCPVRDSCSAFRALPAVAEAEVEELVDMVEASSSDRAALAAALAEVAPADRESLWEWYEHANATKLLITKAIEEVKGRFDADAWAAGGLRVGQTSWRIVDDQRNTTDARALHDELGDERFYRLASTQISAAAIEREVAGDEPGRRARVLDTIRQRLVGSKIARKRERR